LSSYLLKSNQFYKSDDDIEKREQELYSLQFYFSNFFYGKQRFFALNANMIAPNVIQDDYSKEAFEFMRDILKKPDFTNQDMLDLVKRNFLSGVRLSLSDNDSYANNMYYQMVLPDERRKYDDSTDIDYITNMIQSVTLEDLEREYNLIVGKFINGYVFGNILEEQFNSFVDCISLAPIQPELNYSRNISTVEGDMEIEKDMEQSYIYVTYDIDKLTQPQIKVLYYILNSTLGLCYQTLREKYGLVYGASARIRQYDNKLVIYAETDKNKKEKFLQALDEIVADLNNPQLLERLIARAKDEYFADEYTFDEDHERIIGSIDSFLLKLDDGLDRNEINEGVQNLTS
jgi:predicted Zn-dependent peptidase